MVKLAIVYYSSYGTAHAMASRLAETAEKLGAEVRLRRVRETAPDEVVQGVEWGRPSELHVEVERRGREATSVRVGGASRAVGGGWIDL